MRCAVTVSRDDGPVSEDDLPPGQEPHLVQAAPPVDLHPDDVGLDEATARHRHAELDGASERPLPVVLVGA